MVRLHEEALIINQKKVALQTYRLELLAPEISRLARAGQFMMLQVRSGLDPLLRRPFSFHQISPGEKTIQILYRVVGRGTWWLSQAQPGTRISLIGPLGNGFEIPREEAGSMALVAGGIGIAPLLELALQLCSGSAGWRKRNIHLFYGTRTAEEFIPIEPFDDLGIDVHLSTDDASLGFGGNVVRLFSDIAEREALNPSVVYACGPLIMQYHVARWVRENHIPSQLSLESLMACGVGACLGCALPAPHPSDPTADHYVHVCKDGPIFEAGSIQWSKIQPQPAPRPIFLYS